MITRALLLKELKIIFKYCLIPIPISLLWSLIVGGIEAYPLYVVQYTAVAFELFGVIFMGYIEDYGRLKSSPPRIPKVVATPESPDADETTIVEDETHEPTPTPEIPEPESNAETKKDMAGRALVALWTFIFSFMFTVQLANRCIQVDTPENESERPPQAAILFILDQERRMWVLLPFLQLGVASCLAFVRVVINLAVLLTHVEVAFKYAIYGLLFHHYVTSYVVPVFY